MENKIDVSKYGFELFKRSESKTEFYRRQFDDFYVELMVAENVYSVFIEKKDSNIVVANRYKVENQEELDFLIFRGRVGSWFNKKS